MTMAEITPIMLRNVSWHGPRGVEAVSFSLQPGQFVALTGPSGAGKACLLKLISRRAPPHLGAVCLFSRDIWLMSEGEVDGTVSVICPDDPQLQDLSPLQIVDSAWWATSSTVALCRHANAAAALLRQGIAPEDGRQFGELPLEDRLRVLVARVLIRRPPIVLLTHADDPAMLHLQLDLLSALRGAGATLVAAIEDVAHARRMADRVIELDQGHVMRDSVGRRCSSVLRVRSG